MLMNKEYRDEQWDNWYESVNYKMEELGIYDDDLKAEICDEFSPHIPSDQDILDFVEDYNLRQQEHE